MRTIVPAALFMSVTMLLSTGCSKAPPADKPDAASASEVVLNVPGMT